MSSSGLEKQTSSLDASFNNLFYCYLLFFVCFKHNPKSSRLGEVFVIVVYKYQKKWQVNLWTSRVEKETAIVHHHCKEQERVLAYLDNNIPQTFIFNSCSSLINHVYCNVMLMYVFFVICQENLRTSFKSQLNLPVYTLHLHSNAVL